jgi:hypothetical protein
LCFLAFRKCTDVEIVNQIQHSVLQSNQKAILFRHNIRDLLQDSG